MEEGEGNPKAGSAKLLGANLLRGTKLARSGISQILSFIYHGMTRRSVICEGLQNVLVDVKTFAVNSCCNPVF